MFNKIAKQFKKDKPLLSFKPSYTKEEINDIDKMANEFVQALRKVK